MKIVDYKKINVRLPLSLIVLFLSISSIFAQRLEITEANPSDLVYSSFRLSAESQSNDFGASLSSDVVWFPSFGRIYVVDADRLEPLWTMPYRFMESPKQLVKWIEVSRTKDGTPIICAVKPEGNGLAAYHGVLGYLLWEVDTTDDPIISDLEGFSQDEPVFYCVTEGGSILALWPKRQTSAKSTESLQNGSAVKVCVNDQFITVSTSSKKLEVFNRVSMDRIEILENFPAEDSFELFDDVVVYVETTNDNLTRLHARRIGLSENGEFQIHPTAEIPGAQLGPVVPFDVNKFALMAKQDNDQLVIQTYQLNLNPGYEEVQLEKIVSVNNINSDEDLALYAKEAKRTKGELLLVTADCIFQFDLGFSSQQRQAASLSVEEIDVAGTNGERFQSLDVHKWVKDAGLNLEGLLSLLPHVQLDSRYSRIFVPIKQQSDGASIIRIGSYNDLFTEVSSSSMLFDHGMLFQTVPRVLDGSFGSKIVFLDRGSRLVTAALNVDELRSRDISIVYDQVRDSVRGYAQSDELTVIATDAVLHIIDNDSGASSVIKGQIAQTAHWHSQIGITDRVVVAASTDSRIFIIEVDDDKYGSNLDVKIFDQWVPAGICNLRSETELVAVDVFNRSDGPLLVLTGINGNVAYQLSGSGTARSIRKLWSIEEQTEDIVHTGRFDSGDDASDLLMLVEGDEHIVRVIDPAGMIDGNDGITSEWENSADANDLIVLLETEQPVSAPPSANNLFAFVPTVEGIEIFYLHDGSRADRIDLGEKIIQQPVFLSENDILVCSDAAGRVNFIRVTGATRRLVARYLVGQGTGPGWFFPYRDEYIIDGLIGVQTEDGTLLFFNPGAF